MLLERAKNILLTEADAIKDLVSKLDESFIKAVNVLKNTKGRIICTGMGKPGLIARKIAATIASTGSQSFYVHPAETIHGDIGMFHPEDTVLLLSYSGETQEIIQMLPLIKTIGCTLIAMTGNMTSTLAKYSDIVLDVSVEKEACSMGLAPSSSSTASLAMGDALAITLYEEKGFTSTDFARLHPGGNLGKKLLLKVSDIMRDFENTPKIQESESLQKATSLISSYKTGTVIIVDDKGFLKGIVTDGDLRRSLLEENDLLNCPIKKVMTKDPIYIHSDDLAVEALRLIKANKIDELPVLNSQKKLTGLVDVQDLLDVGVL
ncbi:hypothetical protein AB834_02590 [PVC group bacterium (ex Bugula neritina AB1)]|nr:hypothetical protein AB834_02590 [PVC group bacterium (ex Bugula neritina AB1)]